MHDGYHSYQGRKGDILEALAGMGIKPAYDKRDRSMTFEDETIAGVRWSALIVRQNSIIECMFAGKAGGRLVGSNFAVLAYEARQAADPTFKRESFKAPARYPRPHHRGSPDNLKEIVVQEVALVRLIKDEIRRRANEGNSP
jgi:hypothetical protein